MTHEHRVDSFTVLPGELERINEGMRQRNGDARHIISIVREEVRGARVGECFYRVFYRVPPPKVDESMGFPLDYEEEVKRLRFENEHLQQGLPKPPKKPTKMPAVAGPESIPMGCCILFLAFLALYIVGSL